MAVRSWRSGFGTQALRLVSSTCVLISAYSKNNISDSSGIFRGWRWCNRPLWSDREFLDNFCSVFVSINLRLNCKIRVPRLLPVKNCIKIIILRTKKNNFFSGEGPSPSTIFSFLDAYGASPLLTKILHMPLSDSLYPLKSVTGH